ncbi:MAG: GDP-L-fucose synthase family protein, partial [Microthrixaceae bacterium]
MTAFWDDTHVLVTGGNGFLGSAVVRTLEGRSPARISAPTSQDYDLRRVDAVDAMFRDLAPDLIVHLAARVGGIGANMARPGELYLDNLLMGTYVIDAARRSGTPKTVVIGTICSYPKHTPVPFHEDSLWQGYPEETNAPYGVAKLAQLTQIQANRDEYGQSAIYLLPTNLYGPGDKFHPAVSHVIPALIKKCVDAKEAGEHHIDVWGTGSATREFLFVDDAAEAIVAASERYDGAEPVNLGTDEEMPIKDLVGVIADLVGFDGEIRWDTSKPDGQPRRRVDPS